MSHSTVLILDYGSQYTQLIARRVREMGVFSVILPGDVPLERIRALSPRAVVLSGGPSSVYEKGAPALPEGFLDWAQETTLPILGVCYGMQLLVQALGGKVVSGKKREYGSMPILLAANPSDDNHGSAGSKFRVGRFFEGVPHREMGGAHSSESRPHVENPPAHAGGSVNDRCFSVWMSHGDETHEVPPGFRITAKSQAGAVAAMECEDASKPIYAIQFHAEVTHTTHGQELLRHFILELARIRPDWSMRSVAEEKIEAIRNQIGPTEHVICALSGGVDSAVAAALVHRAIGDRLHCFFVDHGLLRHEEQARVMKMFSDHLHLTVSCIDASERFLTRLQGVSDPETKRKIIGGEFIACFEDEAHRLGKTLGHIPKFLVQGTLYPDVIESSPGHKHSATIKSHHNVGGLPRNLRFSLVEPLRELFKDEVRTLGKELGVPEEFLKRHPFPGPGLAVRVLGDIDQEKLTILRQADEIFIQSIREFGLYDQIWQAFAVFLPIRSVGVQGDGRTHDYVVGLRAVTSQDGMTADWFPFEHRFLAEVSSRICNQVRGVNRVVYDISSKPPATIEWE